MASKQKPYVMYKDGFCLKWYTRRSALDVDVFPYHLEMDQGGEMNPVLGPVAAELAYPKVAGIGFSDFAGEAVAIAKRHLEVANGR